MSDTLVFIVLTVIFFLSFLANLWLPTIIALLCFVRYSGDFVDLLKKGLANEWPYNTIAVVGALLAFLLYPVASLAANFAISGVTGFHSSFFVNSIIVLSMLAYLYLLMFAVAIIAAVAAITIPAEFATKRVISIALALAIVSIVAASRLLGQDEKVIERTEALIIALDFNHNARFEHGRYLDNDKKGQHFGTKVCKDLPFDALVSPHPQGGYIVATPRASIARLRNPIAGLSDKVLATSNTYSHLPQDKCPVVHEYLEEAAK